MEAESERFDNLFMTIAQGVHGIDNLLGAFFGFLGRKTDFYGASEAEVKDAVLRAVANQRPLALKRLEEEREARRQADEARRRKREEQQRSDEEKLRKFHEAQDELRKGPRVEEVREHVTTDISAATKDTQHASKAPKVDDDNKEGKEEEDDDSPPPAGNGGTTDRYVWTQQLPVVDIFIDVPSGTTSRQCVVSWTPTHMRVAVGGRVIVDGELHGKIKPDDCVWTLEDGRQLHITLEKLDSMKWWSCVMVGDPEINTRRIVPENSKLSDLDPELRQTVEKMMYDQEMKSRGLPTSDQSKQATLLNNFMQQHPELDFSNAKINWGGSFGGM